MKRISCSILCILLLFLINCNISYCNEEVKKPIFEETGAAVRVNSENAPLEERDEKYIKFLSPSLKISVSGASGSGTIFHYSHDSKWAYIISCGHLWNGNKHYDPKNLSKAKVITWYHNDLKLKEPKSYEAEVLFWSNERGYDASCLRFKPDWKPNYFPIAKSFEFKKGMYFNSVGCDGGKEVARYEVKFKEFNGLDIITELNSPRPGRSGGGLLTDSGWYVGICWGTSDTVSGNGIGYFTPISSIKKVFKENNHEWLLNTHSEIVIPIYDWSNPGKQYNKDFVPVPIIAF